VLGLRWKAEKKTIYTGIDASLALSWCILASQKASLSFGIEEESFDKEEYIENDATETRSVWISGFSPNESSSSPSLIKRVPEHVVRTEHIKWSEHSATQLGGPKTQLKKYQYVVIARWLVVQEFVGPIN